MAKRPYQGFRVDLYEPADVTLDAGLARMAAKLLRLSDDMTDKLLHSLQWRCERYHGKAAATKSSAELKRELGKLSRALLDARYAWAVMSFDARLLIRETYSDIAAPQTESERERRIRPRSYFEVDGPALLRAANVVTVTEKKIAPGPPGPAPNRLAELASSVFELGSIAVGRDLRFGTAKRVRRETGFGKRTEDYNACVLLMRAVDPTLTDSQCEGPLEAALRANGKTDNRKTKQPPPRKTRVKRGR